MRNIYKNILCSAFLFVFLTGICVQNSYSATSAPAKTSSAAVTTPATIAVSPVDFVNNVPKYINKNISFTAEFVAFTSLGLDYKPAFRDSAKYIGVLIKRPDVTTHTIPLSEMKIFVLRETAEKNIDIEAGDKIKIEGKVFSDALGDPWVDCSSFTMLTHKAKTEKKK